MFPAWWECLLFDIWQYYQVKHLRLPREHAAPTTIRVQKNVHASVQVGSCLNKVGQGKAFGAARLSPGQNLFIILW